MTQSAVEIRIAGLERQIRHRTAMGVAALSILLVAAGGERWTTFDFVEAHQVVVHSSREGPSLVLGPWISGTTEGIGLAIVTYPVAGIPADKVSMPPPAGMVWVPAYNATDSYVAARPLTPLAP